MTINMIFLASIKWQPYNMNMSNFRYPSTSTTKINELNSRPFLFRDARWSIDRIEIGNRIKYKLFTMIIILPKPTAMRDTHSKPMETVFHVPLITHIHCSNFEQLEYNFIYAQIRSSNRWNTFTLKRIGICALRSSHRMSQGECVEWFGDFAYCMEGTHFSVGNAYCTFCKS